LDEDGEIKTILVIIFHWFGHLIRWFPFQIIRSCYYWNPKKSKDAKINDSNITEILIIVDLVLGLVLILSYQWLTSINLIGSVIIGIFFIWAILRIGDIFVYQIYAIKVTEKLISPIRTVALVLFNLFEIILWFAFFYLIFQDSFLIEKEVNIATDCISKSLFFFIL
jgi:hypothetical protein